MHNMPSFHAYLCMRPYITVQHAAPFWSYGDGPYAGMQGTAPNANCCPLAALP
jgi:hypothetical protein